MSLDLERIGTIRNKFAHKFFDLKFTDKEVADVCKELTAFGIFKKASVMLSPRDRFEVTVFTTADRLLLIGLATEHHKRDKQMTRDELATKTKRQAENASQ
jgi:hypothetical protein